MSCRKSKIYLYLNQCAMVIKERPISNKINEKENTKISTHYLYIIFFHSMIIECTKAICPTIYNFGKALLCIML